MTQCVADAVKCFNDFFFVLFCFFYACFLTVSNSPAPFRRSSKWKYRDSSLKAKKRKVFYWILSNFLVRQCVDGQVLGGCWFPPRPFFFFFFFFSLFRMGVSQYTSKERAVNFGDIDFWWNIEWMEQLFQSVPPRIRRNGKDVARKS